MRSVALVIVVFLLLAAGIGLIEAGGPLSGSKGNFPGPLHPLAPSAPMNLVATAGVAQVGLTWQTPSSIDPGYPITNYRVFRRTAPGTAIFLVDAGDVLSHTDTGLTNGVTYHYQVSAVGLGEGPRSNEDSATPTATAADPSISIVEPTAGATVGTVVFLQVQITGFIIDAENVGQANVPGRGHYHVTVDGTTIDFMVTGLIYAVKDLTEGQHTIRVSLHNNDHSALTPEIGDEVTVNVAAPAPPPAGIDPVVFAGTTIGLIVLLIVVAVALILWGRRGRRAP